MYKCNCYREGKQFTRLELYCTVTQKYSAFAFQTTAVYFHRREESLQVRRRQLAYQSLVYEEYSYNGYTETMTICSLQVSSISLPSWIHQIFFPPMDICRAPASTLPTTHPTMPSILLIIREHHVITRCCAPRCKSLWNIQCIFHKVLHFVTC